MILVLSVILTKYMLYYYLLPQNKLPQSVVVKTTIITYYPCRFWGQEFGSGLLMVVALGLSYVILKMLIRAVIPEGLSGARESTSKVVI